MADDHTHPYKAFLGNSNKTNIVFIISTYSLVQKLLSSISLMLLCPGCLLFTLGFRCNPKSRDLPKLIQSHDKLNKPTLSRCLGTVTTLGMGDAVGYLMVDHNPHQHKQDVSKVDLLLDDNGSIAPKIDDALPKWAAYGIAPFMPCQQSILNDRCTFSLQLDNATFQSGEQLGFILLKNNRSPADLIKHLLKIFIQSTDQIHPSTPIKDYLMLPGVITQHLLQSEYIFDSFTDLNSYTTIYCYLKKGLHYCLIPLENIVAPIKTADSAFISFSQRTPPTSVQASPSSLESSVTTPAVSPLASQKGEPLDALPMVNRRPAEDRSIGRHHPHVGSSGLSLFEELAPEISGSMGDPRIGNGMVDYSTHIDDSDSSIDMFYNKALSEQLGNLEIFTKHQTEVTEIVKKIEILPLNFTINHDIRLRWGKKIALALGTAFQQIEILKSALAFEQDRQLGIEYSSNHTDLDNQRKVVIEKLENLENAILEPYLDQLSEAASLNLVIESLVKMYHGLHEMSIRLQKLDTTDRIRCGMTKLFNPVQLKEGQKIIAQLEAMESDQLSMIRNFRKEISDMEDALSPIGTDLAPTIRGPLEAIKRKIERSDLKSILKKEAAIIAGRVTNSGRLQEIIRTLESKMADIQKILNGAALNTLTVEIVKKIEETVNYALNLEKKFKQKMQSKAEEIEKQTRALKELLNENHPYYDSGYEEE